MLEELARCTHVEFVADDAIREDTISADLLDVPLDQAVRLLIDSEPKVRERPYEALMERPSDRGRELILDAIRGISEDDQGLRQRLLSDATSKGIEIPTDLLVDLVHTDGSEGMRLIALDVLATRAPGPAKRAAEAALNDPSPSVRERAADILGERHQL